MFPNATVAEFGIINHTDASVHRIKSELFARGPVAASINGQALHNYSGGVIQDEHASKNTTHAVQIIGWETDPITHRQAWICRNSWGTCNNGFGVLYALVSYLLLRADN